MQNNSKDISLIYRYLYKHGSTHRNVLKKELIKDGRFSSKNRYSAILEGLISLGCVESNGEFVKLNSQIVQTGVLQKDNNGFFVTTNVSRKHLPVEKSVAAGFGLGEPLDVIVEFHDNKPTVTVLGHGKELNIDTRSLKNKLEPISSKINTENLHQNKPIKAKTYLENENRLLGRVIKVGHDDLIFIPNRKDIPIRHIPITNDKKEQPQFQDKICVIELEDINIPLMGGKIVKVLGNAGNPVHEFQSIARNYGLDVDWSLPEIQKELKNIPTEVDISKLDLISEEQAMLGQKGKTVDLRELQLYTLDPPTCNEMDDAIGVKIDENGDYICYIAVANVAEYVDLDSTIGKIYFEKGFNIYTPTGAFFILPPAITTGICSLNPNVDRRALVYRIVIDKTTGKQKSGVVFDAVMQSKQKYSYAQAQEIIDNIQNTITKEDLRNKIARGESLSPEEGLFASQLAANAIMTNFKQRHMIQFDNDEREYVLDSDKEKIVDIKVAPRLPTMKIIEAFMITAGEFSAKFIKDNNLKSIYRIHEEPSQNKIDRVHEIFEILGVPIGDDLSAQSTIELLERVKDSPNKDLINDILIRSQSRAVYSRSLFPEKRTDQLDMYDNLISHYALGSKHYTQATAPARRMGDILVQKALLSYIHETEPVDEEILNRGVEILNQRQLDVDQAHRDVEDFSSVLYSENIIGSTLNGSITNFRYSSQSEGLDDEIVVIVKDKKTGISVEIPLCQVIGRNASDCRISEHGCAIFDGRGNVILTICSPLNFVVTKADKKSMTIYGTTSKSLNNAEDFSNQGDNKHYFGEKGFLDKTKRQVRYHDKAKHKTAKRDKYDENYNHKHKKFGDE